MRYWLTTQWPPRKGQKEERRPGVSAPEGRTAAISRVSPGDFVWVYQSGTGRPIRRTHADGTSSIIRCEPGAQAVVALLQVTAPAFARKDRGPETYDDGTTLWWRWFAPAEIINSAGRISRSRIAELIGYASNYVFRGFGEDQSGLKELGYSTFHSIKAEFLLSHLESDEVKLQRIAKIAIGAGGEGPVHKALKKAIEEDAAGVLGEPGLTHVRTEFPFPTGDRIDVLLRDQEGRYVAIEIEPDCSQHEVCGPLQAMKYRSLLAYALSRPENEVRTLLVSRSIHEAVREKCGGFGVECHVIEAP